MPHTNRKKPYHPEFFADRALFWMTQGLDLETAIWKAIHIFRPRGSRDIFYKTLAVLRHNLRYSAAASIALGVAKSKVEKLLLKKRLSTLLRSVEKRLTDY